MLLRLFGWITLLELAPPWTEVSQPWLTITVSGTRPDGLGGELRRKCRRVVERCYQDLRPALLGKEAPQLRLRVEKVAAAVELDWHNVRKMPMQALGDPDDASLDGLRGILDGSQNGGRKQAAGPRRQRKSAQCVAGEAAGLAIVR